jgi:hypothetical protein
MHYRVFNTCLFAVALFATETHGAEIAQSLQFSACPTQYQVYNALNLGDSIRATFVSPAHDYQLLMQLNDKVSTTLQIDQKNGTWFIFWQWFQPSSYAVATLTSLAAAKHRVRFALFFHPVGGGAPTNQMAFDSYSFDDDGPC